MQDVVFESLSASQTSTNFMLKSWRSFYKSSCATCEKNLVPWMC